MREEKDLKEKTIDQELNLQEVQEVLKELCEKLLENSIELKDVALSIHSNAKDIHFDKDENVVVDIKEIVNIEAHLDSESKNKYEEIVNKLKKDLPRGYTIESIFDEEAGIVSTNIKGVTTPFSNWTILLLNLIIKR